MTPIDELKIFCGTGSSLSDALRILANASFAELNYVLDKINYYIEHINVISAKCTIVSKRDAIKTKKEFLQGLQKILVTELDRRRSLSRFS